jgi:hypothetical protein
LNYDTTLTKWVLQNPANGVNATVITNKIQAINGTVSGNALTLTLNPTVLDFRSSTLTSGTVNTRTISGAINLVISSGSTLGTVSAQQSRIVVLAIDNAGTIELAAVNLAGGTNLSETGFISTTAEGGAGAADSATVIYSTTARSNVPYRVVGYVESTQATAGTWATAPSTIQGYGGQALAAMSSYGFSQTWQNMTGSRALSTTYYNTTGKLITVTMTATSSGASEPVGTLIHAGVTHTFSCYGQPTPGQTFSLTLEVPAGASYSIAASAATITRWAEFK